MSHIFISYSRRDAEIVDRFASELTKAGLDIWLDRQDIKVGDAWRLEIVRAIDICDALVLVLSRHSAASENVRKEVDLAQDSGKKIFVLMLEKIAIPAELRYQLAGLQFADVPEYGFETSTQGLTQALKKHIAENPQVPAARREVEMAVRGFTLSTFNQAKQSDLLDFISQIAHANKSEMQIVNLESGNGLHVFMDVPASAAFTLKTMALNQDKRLREKNITALRLKGNRRFIKISAGLLTFAAITALFRTRWARVWLSGCSCFTCLAVVGVLAWEAGGITVPPQSRPPSSSRIAPTAMQGTSTHIPTDFVPVTGVTATDQAACYIAIASTFAFEGPSRGYNVASYERYKQGERFIALMSDRSGEWLYGILPDHTKGWLRIDWVSGNCYSPAIPTASFIPQPPPTRFPTRKPSKH